MQLLQQNNRNTTYRDGDMVVKVFASEQEYRREVLGLQTASHGALPLPVPQLLQGDYATRTLRSSWLPHHPWTDTEKEQLLHTPEEAGRLMEFLAQAHRLPISKALPPVDVAGFVHKAVREGSEMQQPLIQRAVALLAQLPIAPPGASSVFVHGDVHPGNILFSADGRIAGVIDWGHAGASTPETDLRQLFYVLGEAALPLFRSYEQHSGTTLDMPLLLRLSLARCVEMAHHYHSQNNHGSEYHAMLGRITCLLQLLDA